MLEERTGVAGFHDFLFTEVIMSPVRPPGRAVDLGAGSGALAFRLASAGLDTVAVDVDVEAYRAPLEFRSVDLDSRTFAQDLGRGQFDLVTSVEVIEHLESPINFLRNVASLLNPTGTAVITTPNVDNVPARLQFLLEGTIRALDDRGEPTHITPIFWDLLTRQWLPRAGLALVAHRVYPHSGFPCTRRRYIPLVVLLQRTLRGYPLTGESHVFILRRADT